MSSRSINPRTEKTLVVQDDKDAELFRRLKASRGILKRKGYKVPTDEEMEKVREQAGREILKKHGLL